MLKEARGINQHLTRIQPLILKTEFLTPYALSCSGITLTRPRKVTFLKKVIFYWYCKDANVPSNVTLHPNRKYNTYYSARWGVYRLAR